ncbi:carboxypeptidase regulatory-like domain-containing protein [Cellulomonas edaphi]|uniref:Carboxypeptidase regulatory-like domain-containing protein n=1 Tax=Cellulomonas edaphi TaxID=3053468 RepID=A0ABT7SBG9_9CELL|nr:carboxypeptidase regulatory-like domain-containing protein [Cellulomons edaphi]MDM7832342.1 carboxypeptidase regulatory-like domain-containing protein [Cellulomons edaphi]
MSELDGRRRAGLAVALASALVVGLVGAQPAVAVDETISGQVTFQGTGVPGLTVSVSHLEIEDEMNPDAKGIWLEEYHGTTDASGHYSIPVGIDTYLVSVGVDRPSDYLVSYSGSTVRLPEAKLLRTTSGAHLSANIALVAAAKVTGTVVDSSGIPRSNVHVGASTSGRAGGGEATTDAEGRYTIGGLPTGTVTVYTGVWGQGRQQTVAARQGTTTTVPTITQLKPSTITGTLDGKYPRNQDFALLDTKHHQVAEATPDRTGHVRFTNLKQGAYRVVVSGTNLSRRVVVETGKTASFGTITRANRTDIRGVVLSPSGKPVAGALVTATDSFGTDAGVSTPTWTDSAGRYTISSAAISGSYTVTAGAPGYARGLKATTVVKGEDTTGVTVRLRTAGTLTGVVKNAQGGKPVAGVAVGFTGSAPSTWVTTDTSGRWTIRGLLAGAHTLRFADPNAGGYLDATKSATVVAGTTVTVPTVVLH